MLKPTTRVVGIAAVILVAAASRSVRAQAAPPSTAATVPPEHRGLSLLLNAGSYTGFGAGLALGTRAVGIRGTAGWSPVIVGVENGSSTDLKFYSGFTAGADVYARIWSPQPTTDLGALLGYRYDTLLGHGFAAGVYVQLPLSRAVDLNVSIGLLVFPDGDDHLKQEENLPSSVSFSFPGPKVNYALSASLAFFP